MIIIFILGLLLTIAACVLTVHENKNNSIGYVIVAMIGTILWTLSLKTYCDSQKPQSIDVYQGHTTLKYTVLDDEIIDSTVVWKPEYKK